jgi:hypothetical protein
MCRMLTFDFPVFKWAANFPRTSASCQCSAALWWLKPPSKWEQHRTMRFPWTTLTGTFHPVCHGTASKLSKHALLHLPASRTQSNTMLLMLRAAGQRRASASLPLLLFVQRCLSSAPRPSASANMKRTQMAGTVVSPWTRVYCRNLCQLYPCPQSHASPSVNLLRWSCHCTPHTLAALPLSLWRSLAMPTHRHLTTSRGPFSACARLQIWLLLCGLWHPGMHARLGHSWAAQPRFLDNRLCDRRQGFCHVHGMGGRAVCHRRGAVLGLFVQLQRSLQSEPRTAYEGFVKCCAVASSEAGSGASYRRRGAGSTRLDVHSLQCYQLPNVSNSVRAGCGHSHASWQESAPV